MEPVYRFHFTVTPEAVDVNRHVNNVAYVQWMQDVAIQHANATGCSALTKAAGAIWVARSHHIDYLSPAFAGDAITIVTWIACVRKVRSKRRYKFIRDSDQAILACGETDWVFVDAQTGRPRSIPEEINDAFGVLADDPEV
jgi:acyl-CoA thioester hydrolase